MPSTRRDHGGGLDAAIAVYGGQRGDWLDLSTGINPQPYPIPEIGQACWTQLPDSAAEQDLLKAARSFWGVPKGADIVAAPGASALIAQMPHLFAGHAVAVRTVSIPEPTYNEHAAAFRAHGWEVNTPSQKALQVLVHPNNPDGRLWEAEALTGPTIIDESFADVVPGQSHVAQALRDDCVVLKSFGKFWGLAGLRLGFAIASKPVAAQLREMIGPWAVSGPALTIGRAALDDTQWADGTRARLQVDAARLDGLMARAGAQVVGGTPLFRLYDVGNAVALQNRLARAHIWTRIFPYSQGWMRLGLPPAEAWPRLEAALT